MWEHFETISLSRCDYTATPLTQYLVITHFSSYIVSLFVTAISLAVKEIYLLIGVSMGLWLNLLLNVIVKAIVRDVVPNGTCGSDAYWCQDPLRPDVRCELSLLTTDPAPGCSPCASPSFQIQELTFIMTTLWIYAATWRPHVVTVITTVLLVTWFGLTVHTHVLMGFNSPAQVLLGSGLGAGLAGVWGIVTYLVLQPKFDQWRRSIPFTWMAVYQNAFAHRKTLAVGDRVYSILGY